jgi:hypothetical protein
VVIDFVTAAGKHIKYDTGGNILTSNDLNNIADYYAVEHPDILPTHVWMRADVYKEYASIHTNHHPIVVEDGKPCLLISTGCGLLIVKPLPYGFNKFVVLVGTKEDYDHYFIDEVFEETVLNECERE